MSSMVSALFIFIVVTFLQLAQSQNLFLPTSQCPTEEIVRNWYENKYMPCLGPALLIKQKEPVENDGLWEEECEALEDQVRICLQLKQSILLYKPCEPLFTSKVIFTSLEGPR